MKYIVGLSLYVVLMQSLVEYSIGMGALAIAISLLYMFNDVHV